MKKLLLGFSVVLVFVVWASFMPQAQAQTPQIQLTVDYNEPTKNADSNRTPLTDLDYTTIFVEVYDEGGVVLGNMREVIVKAEDATGGNHIQEVIKIEPDDQAVEAKVWVSATDFSGNTSKNTQPITKPIVFVDVTAPDVPTGTKLKIKTISITR